MEKHWYKVSTTECPICGRGETVRERMLVEKPEDYRERYDFELRYDYCDV